MVNNKQLIINMIAQIIAFFVNIAIGFFLTPYVVKTVGEAAYGFVGLANNFINYATIVTVALNSMAGRFITISIHQERYEDTNKYITSVFFANLFVSVIFVIIAVFVLLFLRYLIVVPENIIIDVTILWILIFGNFILSLIGNVFSVATFAKNRLDLSSVRSIESNILKCIILIVSFCFFKPSVWYLGLSTFICGIYVVLTNLYYTNKLLPLVKIRKKYFDFLKIKEIIMSGMWNSLSKLSGILSTGLDLLITNLFVGADAMGVVSISKLLPSYILAAFGTISSVFMPQLTISYAKENYDDIKNQLNTAVRLLGFFACIPIGCMYAYGKEFFALWMPGQDSVVLNNLLFLGTMAFVFSLPLEPLWNIFTVTNKVKTSSLFLLMNSIVSIIMTFVLLFKIQSMEYRMYIVVGTSTVLSVIRGGTFLPIYGAKCLNFKWYTFYGIIIKNIFSVILVTGISFIIKFIIVISSWYTLIINIIITSIVACMVNYFVLLRKTERKIIISKMFKRSRQI